MRKVQSSTPICQKKLSYVLDEASHGLLGYFMPLSFDLEPFEWKYVIRKFAGFKGVTLTRDQISKILFLIDKKASDKCILAKNFMFVVDRGYLFLVPQEKKDIPTKDSIAKSVSWSDLFTTISHLSVPKGYELKSYSPNDRLTNNKRIKDWYSENKVPAFLRNRVKVLSKNGLIHADFLTGFLSPSLRK